LETGTALDLFEVPWMTQARDARITTRATCLPCG